VNGDAGYTCWFQGAMNAVLLLVFTACSVALPVLWVVGRLNVRPFAVMALVGFTVLLGYFQGWRYGYSVRIERSHLAWRSLLRRRWIALDRVASVRVTPWPRQMMTIRTDDGVRLCVFVPGGYQASALRFAARFDVPADI